MHTSRILHVAAALSVAAAITITPLGAQRAAPPVVDHLERQNADGTVTKIPIAKPTGFSLFAGEDQAFGSLRMSGTFRTAAGNRGGPASESQGSSAVNNSIFFGPGYSGYIFFQMGFIGGAPPHEFRKIRAINPAINNMQGSLGYATTWWETLATQRRGWDAADGQFGRVFSGVTAAADGSCRDDVRFLLTGFSLLPMKDCPASWGSEGFRGKLAVPDSVWLNRFSASRSDFRWDDWRIPSSQLDTANLLGTQSLYGYMSDYNREQRLRYGSIIPGGTGTPQDQGYPLGLELRIDTWTFSAPATRNTQFYQVTMVNKSAQVYGTGIDYDSLYFGTAPGFLLQGSTGQTASVYFDFGTNTFYATKGNTSGNCGTSYPRRYTNAGVGACLNTNAFFRGVYAMTWLKSPLGDLRNKHFSNPASPYYNPTSPLADDTITFNHSHHNSVTTTSQTIARSTRSAFGQISSTELNVLDGRQPSDFTLGNFVNLFQPEDWSGTYPTLENTKFNKFVPGAQVNPLTGVPFGKWDYNNDGVQDTISVPSCGRNGCAALYSDTIAGGYNTNYGNILNSITAGPFKLRANDTTQFLWAMTWAPDSVGVRQNVEGAVTSYLTNYSGPQPIAFPTVRAGVTYTIETAELVDSVRSGIADSTVGPRVTLRFPTISPVDPYLVNLVNRIRRDSIAGDVTVRRILRLNPGLLASLSARANDNLSQVLVFKSCDNGATFTTANSVALSATCTSSLLRAVDGNSQSFTYQPLTRVSYTNGIPATPTYSEFVMGGRTYNYAFVTRTRGFADFPAVIDSAAGGFFSTDVQTALGFPRDTISSTLATSGPTAATVYAPFTSAAGRSYARVDTQTVRGRATQGLLVGAVSSDASGNTRHVFANRLIVRKTQDTITRATTTTIVADYLVTNATQAGTSTLVPSLVARTSTFTANENIPVRAGTTLLAGTVRGNVGSSRLTVDTLVAPAGTVGYVWVTSDNRPIYATSDIGLANAAAAANQARDQVSSPLFPGFSAVPYDSANTATGFRKELVGLETANGATERDRNFVIRAPGDTLTVEARNYVPQVQGNFISTVPGNKRIRGGVYELTWAADPWGPRAPFRLDPAGSLQAEVDASLREVAAASTVTTEVSPTIAQLVGATAARPLVRVRVPFSMTFRDTDGRTETVRFAMLRRPLGNTRLLGSGNDTVRVSVADSLWMPGDTLIVLQKVERDSSVMIGAVRAVVVTADGSNAFRPIPVLVDSIGLGRFVVACNGGATASGVRPASDDKSCNPLVIGSRGASPSGGYLPVSTGWRQLFELTRTFDAQSEVRLNATPFTLREGLRKADLARVNVVPNPFIVRSEVDNLTDRTPEARVVFTGVPAQGTLRIYSITGQFLQELVWTSGDLTYQGNNASTGDLPYNLRTREGQDLASGLYIFVLTANGADGKALTHRGKFVVIR